MNRRLRVSAFMLAVAAAWWIHWSCQDTRSPKDVGRVIDEGRRVNALILCPDSQEAIEAAAMVSFEPLSGQAVFFNIPPNLCLDGTAEDSSTAENLPATLEAAYARENLDSLKRRLGNLFGPELTFISVLPTDQFLRLVNLMGGLSVNVPTRVSFRSAAQGKSQSDLIHEWIEIPQGEDVFFDAEKTREYLAYRYDGLGIRGQTFRARHVAQAFLRRLKGHLELEWFRQELAAAFMHASDHSVIRLLMALADIPAASITVAQLPGQGDINTGVFWVSRNALKTALPKELKPLILAGGAKSRITVQLLNGSGAPNIAARLRDRLSMHPDVDIVEMGNADRPDYESTEIIDRAGNLRSAERIRELLGAGNLRQQINQKLMLDVTIIIGKDIP